MRLPRFGLGQNLRKSSHGGFSQRHADHTGGVTGTAFSTSCPSISRSKKTNHIIDKYHVEKHDIYYIGDTAGDIREGREAGVKTVGVTWGWHTKDKMLAAAPDYLFDKPEDLLKLN